MLWKQKATKPHFQCLPSLSLDLMLRIIGPLRMQERVESKEGKKMVGRRMSTVEPVFGSLLNYYGMKRSNAKGKGAAHKMMLMAATAYNLHKLLSCSVQPKANVQILTLKQANTLYFVLHYVVQHPGGIILIAF